MKADRCPLLLLFLGLVLTLGSVRPDPDPLQDYCVADGKKSQSFFINGAPCIDPDEVDSSHFATSALSKPGDTRSTKSGSAITRTNTTNLPGMNTLGLTMARVDFAATGILSPHIHPRASEVAICLKGRVAVGFVDTSNRLFQEILSPGDSFVFPKGLIHFISNADRKLPALVLSGYNSQNPGLQLTPTATFASKPVIPDEVLRKAYQVNNQDVARIRKGLEDYYPKEQVDDQCFPDI